MSEFGVAQIGAGEAAEVPRFDEIWAALAEEPYVIGGALWTFNDYRSDYEGTPASGNREWGVVDVERNRKGAYQQVRRAFSPVQELAFGDRIIVLTPRGVDALPSYTLRGYRLEWVAGGAGNGGKTSGVIELPVIKPGSRPLDFSLPTGALKSVRLITPTGYAVADGRRTAE